MHSPHNKKIEEFKKHQADILPITSKYIGTTNLDIGCGNGLTSLIHNEELGTQPTLCDVVDIRDEAVKIFDFTLIKDDTLPFDNKSFDSSYIQYIFHHLVNEKNVLNLIEEAKRVSSRIILVEEVAGEKTNIEKAKKFDLKVNTDIYPEHGMEVYRYYTSDEIKELFKKAGMEVVKHSIISRGDDISGYLETHVFVAE